ncbi:MAG: hypothetical protein CVU12_02065 [Bacteroidetes bacterium HGW-Bacteroidetes-7]|jgi:hypothetical protein|nr:MAG: hypothetical protein CVU12_02065 [Bacteroidetes bacterium HGW-Bacteroidetes-7]
MAYGLKYYSEFRDHFDRLCKLNIELLNYTGEASELELASDPVVIERSVDSVLSPLLTMSCKVNVWSSFNYQFEDLFLAAPRDYKVTFIRNNKILFIGYIEPGLYEEEFIAAPYVISITASDGLKSLESSRPAIFNTYAKSDLITIIKKCLQESINLPINICCSIFAQSHVVTQDNTLFEQCWIDHEGLADTSSPVLASMSAKEILSNIVSAFGCRLYQANGEWYIERIRNRARNQSVFVRFNTDNTKTVVDHSNNVTLGTDSAAWYSEPNLSVEAGSAVQTIKHELLEPDSLIRNNYEGGFTLKVPDWADRVDREKWFRTNSYFHMQTFVQQYDIKRGFSFDHTIVGKLQSVYQVAECTAYGGDTISLTFKVAITATAGTVDKKVIIPYALYIGTFNYATIEGDIKRTSDSSDHKIRKELGVYEDFNGDLTTAVEVKLDTKILPPIAGDPDVNSIKLVFYPSEGIDAYNDIRITHIGDIQVKVNTKKQPNNTFTAKSNKGFWNKAEDVVLKINDAPESILPGRANFRNVRNILVRENLVDLGGGVDVYTAYEPIVGWYDANNEVSSDGRQLSELLLQDTFSQLYDSRATVTGDVMSDIDINPVSIFNVDYRPGVFLMLQDRYDVLSSMHSLTVVQVRDQIIEIA